jgi:hypothetical protein
MDGGGGVRDRGLGFDSDDGSGVVRLFVSFGWETDDVILYDRTFVIISVLPPVLSVSGHGEASAVEGRHGCSNKRIVSQWVSSI